MNMNNILANDIINQLQSQRYNIEWTQFHSMQSDVGEVVEVIIGNDSYWCLPFQSYTTVVGFVLIDERNTFYEVGYYSQTTTRQVNRYCSENSLTKVHFDKRHY